MTETMTWHLASARLPDSDTSVLCWLDSGDWVAGWWSDADGVWRDCSHGDEIETVTHWAEPQGPMQ